MPLPDLCIRTGGDHRISNFLLWQFAHTELFFTDRRPDFNGAALEEALGEFYCRQRRLTPLGPSIKKAAPKALSSP